MAVWKQGLPRLSRHPAPARPGDRGKRPRPVRLSGLVGILTEASTRLRISASRPATYLPSGPSPEAIGSQSRQTSRNPCGSSARSPRHRQDHCRQSSPSFFPAASSAGRNSDGALPAHLRRSSPPYPTSCACRTCRHNDPRRRRQRHRQDVRRAASRQQPCRPPARNAARAAIAPGRNCYPRRAARRHPPRE